LTLEIRGEKFKLLVEELQLDFVVGCGCGGVVVVVVLECVVSISIPITNLVFCDEESFEDYYSPT